MFYGISDTLFGRLQSNSPSRSSCSSLDKSSETRPHFVGFQANFTGCQCDAESSTSCRPGIQVAARPKPAVPGGGMPAHRQRRLALSSPFCQRQRLHRPEDQ